MENINTIEFQFAISAIINGLVHLIILIASIILFARKKSLATTLLFIGSLLISIGFVGGFIYNTYAARKGTEALLHAQVTLAFFNAFSFFVFGIGLFLIALNFCKKN